MPLYTSKDFTIAAEISGTGVRQFSEFDSRDFILTRLYVQRASAYKPVPVSTVDRVYKEAYLVDQVEERRDFGHVWFRRTYATIPHPRTTRQEMVVTFPGRSKRIITTIDNGGGDITLAFRWDRYGDAKPATVNREATVELSYFLGEPSTELPTEISFEDQPVDFTGDVWTEDGVTFLGNTSPLIPPSLYVISDVAKPWRGNIWERQRVTVNRTGV
jgi:hypothetical protein